MSSNNTGLLISSIPLGRVNVLDLLMVEPVNPAETY